MKLKRKITTVGAFICFLMILSAVFIPPAQAQFTPQADRINQFNNINEGIIPELVTLTRELELVGQVEYRELADAAIFGYFKAVQKLGGDYGLWNKNIKKETALFLYMDCFIHQNKKMLPALPTKTKEYVNSLEKLKNIIYTGALDRYIVYVALTDIFYATTYHSIEKKRPEKLSDVFTAEQLFDFKILNQAEKIREQFKKK